MASFLAAAEALRHLKIPSSRVRSTGVELGRGSYGKVFEVEYDGKSCASKEVHRWMMELPTAEEQSKIKDDFLRECHLWSTLRHPNVVQFLGIYYPSSDESVLPVMVMEKMQESVTSLVDKHDNIPLLVKLSILHDVSLGLRYLHGHNPPIVHRDLSPNNILVTPHLEAKITDLGVAKTMMMGPNSKTMTKTPGTGVFMPPEALDNKPVYGPPLDVFSFGGVILHVTSRQWPTPKSWSQIDPKTRKRIILTSEVERRQEYIDMMIGSDADLKPLVVSCLEDDPELRPPAADMSERIKMMKEEYSKKTTHDGMDPISWLGEIKQMSTQLQQLVVKESTIPDLFSGPVNIKWEEGAPAPLGRYYHTAVLYNGVIYVGGGVTKGDDDTIQLPHTLDMYHPDTNTWDTIDTPHQLFAITVLTGNVVIVGGRIRTSGEITNKVLVLESGQWKDYTEMPTARCDVTAVSHQFILIVVGGIDGKDAISTTELFDATTGQWFKCDDLPQPLDYSQSVIVGDTVYVLGGGTKDRKLSTAVYAAPLDTLSSHQVKWQHLVDTPCGGPAAVGLNNKYLLAVGVDDIYTLNSTATKWMTIATLPVLTVLTSVVCDEESRLVMIGGMIEGGRSTNKVWIGSFQ
ncbi:uncharacterized protein [Dysidea avara]|uniref:uncharacterized protein isoform X2 n=1 Tax=Dysidea avara TaxID=196820 RepID=UPI00331CF4B6